MKKLCVLSIILTLIVSTTLIKNATKNIDKQIFQVNEGIRVLNSRNGLLKLEIVQLPNKKAMEVKSLLNGFSFKSGSKVI